MTGSAIRLHVDDPLERGAVLGVNGAAAHYLFNVMRLRAGDGRLRLFNGRDGEWAAEVRAAGRREGTLLVHERTAGQGAPADLWLLFVPLKKEETALVVEKATELGVARLCPVLVAQASTTRFRHERALAHAKEAAEQCGATWIPRIDTLMPLARVLAGWPAGRTLYWADESTAHDVASDATAPRGTAAQHDSPLAAPFACSAPASAAPSAAILIGPEGGFSARERAHLRALAFVRPIRLGPRILRAETAAIAALTLWQAACGDWR